MDAVAPRARAPATSSTEARSASRTTSCRSRASFASSGFPAPTTATRKLLDGFHPRPLLVVDLGHEFHWHARRLVRPHDGELLVQLALDVAQHLESKL